VEATETDGGDPRCRVSIPGDADPRAEISQILSDNGWLCLGLERRSETLEDIYVGFTQSEKVV
jgi:hypothetical protein